MLLAGGNYTEVGRWQELSVDNLPLLLSRQVRVLRSKLGSQVDDREAYVDQVLLNLHTGKGTGRFWFDDLAMDGCVPVPLEQSQHDTGAFGGAQAASFDAAESAAQPQDPGPQQVQLHGWVLTVGGRTLFPRIVEHRGEPFARLKDLGFNAIHLNTPATTTHLDEADRNGLWCVCPPPDVRDGQAIGVRYGPVICWDVGWGLSRQDLDATRQLAADLRRADRLGNRPLLCSPECDLRSYSRYADILLLDRPTLGTSVELSDFGAWLENQPLLARPGTPVWATIQTEPSENIVRQLTALDGGRRPTLGVDLEQIRSLAYTAVAAGARGTRVHLEQPAGFAGTGAGNAGRGPGAAEPGAVADRIVGRRGRTAGRRNGQRSVDSGFRAGHRAGPSANGDPRGDRQPVRGSAGRRRGSDVCHSGGS